jgi:hypothetical protein
MAAITGAVVAAGAAAYSANRQAGAARDAADAQREGADQATAEQRRQYDLSRQDQMPFLEAGYDSLERQNAFLDGDMSGFENNAGYRFMSQEMQRGIERGAASRGALYNGGTNVDLARQLGGFANSTATDYWNKLAGRAGQGQATASGLGMLGANMANQIGANYRGAADAQASSYLARGNAYAGMAGAIGGAFNNWYQQNSANNGGGSGWYLGNNPGPG